MAGKHVTHLYDVCLTQTITVWCCTKLRSRLPISQADALSGGLPSMFYTRYYSNVFFIQCSIVDKSHVRLTNQMLASVFNAPDVSLPMLFGGRFEFYEVLEVFYGVNISDSQRHRIVPKDSCYL